MEIREEIANLANFCSEIDHDDPDKTLRNAYRLLGAVKFLLWGDESDFKKAREFTG